MVVAFAHPADAGAAAESGGPAARTAARFVLKGGAALPVSATPPQRQHSAQAVAQARAENGGAASAIADGSPVRSA